MNEPHGPVESPTRLPLWRGIVTYIVTAVTIGCYLYAVQFACPSMARDWLSKVFVFAYNMSPVLILCAFALLFRSIAAEALLAIGSIVLGGFWIVSAYEIDWARLQGHCEGMGWIVTFAPLVLVPIAAVIAATALLVHVKSQKR